MVGLGHGALVSTTKANGISGRGLNPCLKAKVLLRNKRGRGGEGEKEFLSSITGAQPPVKRSSETRGGEGGERGRGRGGKFL